MNPNFEPRAQQRGTAITEYVMIAVVVIVVFTFAAVVLSSASFSSSEQAVSSVSNMVPCGAGLSEDECK